MADEPAQIVSKRGQVFTVIGTREHTNRHGYPAPLLVLSAACKQCGAPFETTIRMAKKPRLGRKRCFTCSPPRKRASDQ